MLFLVKIDFYLSFMFFYCYDVVTIYFNNYVMFCQCLFGLFMEVYIIKSEVVYYFEFDFE